MVGRGWFVFVLFVTLITGVFFEQRFIDNTCHEMEEKIEVLTTQIEKQDLSASKNCCEHLNIFWEEKEAVLSFLVDFKDIEKIGSQLTLVLAHLENEDFELAFVESKVLMHAVKIFYSTVCFDFGNII